MNTLRQKRSSCRLEDHMDCGRDSSLSLLANRRYMEYIGTPKHFAVPPEATTRASGSHKKTPFSPRAVRLPMYVVRHSSRCACSCNFI